jgi:hypothetical protein
MALARVHLTKGKFFLAIQTDAPLRKKLAVIVVVH